MNKVILMGRLTSDPKMDWTRSEDSKQYATYTLAVNRRFKKNGQADTDFINCVAFGRTAEFLERFGRKGTKFVLEGRIQTGSYTNREGQKVYTTDVVVEEQEFAESRAEAEANRASFQRQSAPSPAPSADAGDGFMNIPDGIDEELPFN